MLEHMDLNKASYEEPIKGKPFKNAADSLERFFDGETLVVKSGFVLKDAVGKEYVCTLQTNFNINKPTEVFFTTPVQMFGVKVVKVNDETKFSRLIKETISHMFQQFAETFKIETEPASECVSDWQCDDDKGKGTA